MPLRGAEGSAVRLSLEIAIVGFSLGLSTAASGQSTP
jgi:hypothetical protein